MKRLLPLDLSIKSHYNKVSSIFARQRSAAVQDGERDAMKKAIWKRLALCVLCLSVLLIPVSAAGTSEQTGSISVTIRYDGQVVPGGTMTLYQVAEYSNGKFIESNLFQDSGFDQTDLSAEKAAEIAKYADEHGIIGVNSTIDEQGKVKFDNLGRGVYLMIQQEAAPGYEAAAPFFVTIPMDGEYDVDASPKVSVTPVSPGPEPSPTPGTSPNPSPSPTPGTSPNPSPSPTPGTSPNPSPSPTPGTSPEPSPSTTPGISPNPSPSNSPGTSPQPSPGVSPGTSPEPSLSVSMPPNPSQSPQVTPPKVTPGNSLPSTGQLSWPIPVLAILGMLLFGLGWYLRQRSR